MNWDLWLAFVGTVVVFMLTPGPSHLLMLGNSLGHGFRRAWPTAAGDLSANALQMLLAGLGLAALLASVGGALDAVRIAGAVYLLWLGVRMIRRAGRAKPVVAIGGGRFFLQGFLTSASNPKAIVFFAALFPQFLRPGEGAFAVQFLVLSLTYIAIDGAFLLLYGAAASRARDGVKAATLGWLQRAGGGALVVMGAVRGLRVALGR